MIALLRARVLGLVITLVALLFAEEAVADEPAPATPPAMDPTTTVSVHVEAPEPIELQVQQRGEWVTVCTSPCDRVVSTTNTYRIDGSGVRTSKPFRISGTGTVRLEVEPASSADHALGVVLVVTGGIGFVPALGVTVGVMGGVAVGLVMICPIVAVFGETFFGGYGECLGDIAVAIGQFYASPWVWAPALSGLVFATGGGALIASSSSTRVTMVPGPSAMSAAVATARLPVWTTHASLAALPPVRTVPLLRVTF